MFSAQNLKRSVLGYQTILRGGRATAVPNPILVQAVQRGAVGGALGALTALLANMVGRVCMGLDPWLPVRNEWLSLVGRSALQAGWHTPVLMGLLWLLFTSASSGLLLGVLGFFIPESAVLPAAIIAGLGAAGVHHGLVLPELPASWRAMEEAAWPGAFGLVPYLLTSGGAALGIFSAVAPEGPQAPRVRVPNVSRVQVSTPRVNAASVSPLAAHRSEFSRRLAMTGSNATLHHRGA